MRISADQGRAAAMRTSPRWGYAALMALFATCCDWILLRGRGWVVLLECLADPRQLLSIAAGVATLASPSATVRDIGGSNASITATAEGDHDTSKLDSRGSRLALDSISVFVAPSDVHGWGCFAGKDFEPFGIIHEASARMVGYDMRGGIDDVFELDWEEDDENRFVMGLGFASVFNHADDPNVEYVWEKSEMHGGMVVGKFFAKRHVRRGEELFITYGDEWWNYRKNMTKVAPGALSPPAKDDGVSAGADASITTVAEVDGDSAGRAAATMTSGGDIDTARGEASEPQMAMGSTTPGVDDSARRDIDITAIDDGLIETARGADDEARLVSQGFRPVLNSFHVSVAPSDVHGWGCFAGKDFKEMEIVHEAPGRLIDGHVGALEDYVFALHWDEERKDEKSILGLGLASNFNHHDDPNLDYIWEKSERHGGKVVGFFFARWPIRRGEELFISYGPEWWEGRNKTKEEATARAPSAE